MFITVHLVIMAQVAEHVLVVVLAHNGLIHLQIYVFLDALLSHIHLVIRMMLIDVVYHHALIINTLIMCLKLV